MSKMAFKNEWGASGANLDPQRPDLFRFWINLPAVVGGVGTWSENIMFAVERFPFPDRAQNTFEMKYLNQTNHILGADAATAPIEIPVRYAFSQPTAQLLYRWHALTSNPRTGAVVRTSQIKTTGLFSWLVPRNLPTDIVNELEVDPNALEQGLTYRLEGCMPINLKPTDANMNETGYVTLTFRLSIDRFYPESLEAWNMIHA